MFLWHKQDQSEFDLTRIDLGWIWNWSWCTIGGVRGGVEDVFVDLTFVWKVCLYELWWVWRECGMGVVVCFMW